MPQVPTLNDSVGDPVVANAAIVPAGPNNATAFYPHNHNTDLLIDTNGYFAAANSAPGPLSLFTLTPCRVLDTRLPNGIGEFTGTIPVGIVGSSCGIPGDNSEAFVLNATVVPDVTTRLGYLTLWPEGTDIPNVSTLNAYDGAVTSNMAIVPAGMGNDSIDAFAGDEPKLTNLILDISSYFAPVAAVDIVSTTLPEGTVSRGYSYQMVASGGIAPYTWSVTSGSPPPGITLASSGLLSGTATSAGTFTFTVEATDSAGSNAPAAHLSLTINTSAGTPTITSPAQLNATLNNPYTSLLTANGGVTPYTWSVVTGSLPLGLSLNSTTGLISGVPGAAGLTNLVVQVEDSQNNTSRLNLAAAVNTGDANGTLNGMYAGSFSGYDNGNWFVAAVSITADGNGNITGGETDSNGASSGVKHATITSGTYSIGSNGLGQISWTDSSGGSVSLLISTGAGEDMRIISFDQSGTGGAWGAGVLRQQNPTDFNGTAQAGSFAFGFQGFDSSGNALAGDGAFQVNSIGNITNGNEDLNDFGTHTQTTFTGQGMSIDSNGRLTVQYQVAGIGTINLAVYVISSTETVGIEIDSGGSLFVTNSLRQTGPFSLGSLNGTAVGRGSRAHYPSSGSPQPDATVLLVGAAGNGNISITEDDNEGGTIAPLNSQVFGTYTVNSSTGRTVFTFTNGAQVACYLVAANQAYCINSVPQSGNNNKGAEVTYFEPQVVPAGGFSAASFSGEYLGGSLPQYTSSPFTQIDTNFSSGLNTFISTYTQSGPSGTNQNQALSGTYNINASSGAITISVEGSQVYAGFMVSANKVEYITVTSGSTPLVLIETTSSAP